MFKPQKQQPRPIGEVIANFMSFSNEPLAKGYRQYLTERVNSKKGGAE